MKFKAERNIQRNQLQITDILELIVLEIPQNHVEQKPVLLQK